ncbi:MAG: hypothetical protein R6V85_20215 [Polyangia bacterium]
MRCPPARIALAALLAAACTDDRAEPEGSSGKAGAADADASAAPGGRADEAERGAKSEKVEVISMADGRHAVFGLSLPRGMKPVPGPNRVYRFESTHRLESVKRYLMGQVETAYLKDEPSGYLVRHAQVLEPAGEVSPEQRLAIRIFRGRRGGATVDVWVESGPGASPARRAKRPAARGAAAGSRSEPVRIEPGSAEARRRQQSKRETFELLQKMQRGEEIDAGSASNPLFH